MMTMMFGQEKLLSALLELVYGETYSKSVNIYGCTEVF